MDAQVTQQMMAKIVQKNTALIGGSELGPLNKTLVADMENASGGVFNLQGTAEILDYTVNMPDNMVVDQLKFCIEFAAHPVMSSQ